MTPSFTSCLTMKPDINVGIVSAVLMVLPSDSSTARCEILQRFPLSLDFLGAKQVHGRLSPTPVSFG